MFWTRLVFLNPKFQVILPTLLSGSQSLYIHTFTVFVNNKSVKNKNDPSVGLIKDAASFP